MAKKMSGKGGMKDMQKMLAQMGQGGMPNFPR